MSKGDVSKARILSAMIDLANTQDYKQITRAEIAKYAGATDSLVSYYFGDMDAIRDAIIQEAIRKKLLTIILQGLVDKHPFTMEIDDELKNEAISSALQDH